MSKWWGIFAASLTGFLYYLAFPGVDYWGFAFIAWIPWMLALRGATPGRAAMQGLAVGLVSHLLGFSWLLEMLKVFSGFSTNVCAVLMVLLCAYQGASFSLLGWLYARASARGWPAGFVFVAAFSACETVYPLLFPYNFGATMHLVYPIAQVAEIGGPLLVALVIFAPGWAISSVIYRWRMSLRGEQALSFSGAFRAEGWIRTSFLLLVPLIASSYGLVRIVQIDEIVENAEKVRVGIVQANISLTDKLQSPADGLKTNISLTRKLVAQEKIELAVWPETAIAGAVQEDQAHRFYKERVTRRLRVPTIIGAVLWRAVDDAREHALFNSALISDRKGNIKGRYDKQFLLLFGEYLPFGEEFPILYEYSPNSGNFSPGKSFAPLLFEGHEIATFICYEDIAPTFVNRLMQHGNPELLVNMTNDAWFGDTAEPWEHMALAKMRAIEQRRFFVRSTNSGVSGFVDPVGRMMKNTGTFHKAAIAEDVAWLTIDTPFRHLGYKPWWALSFAAFAMAFFRRPRPRSV